MLVAEVIVSFPTCPSVEVARRGRPLRAWQPAILVYVDTNGVIETTRGIAPGFQGFCNFANYRLSCLRGAGGHRPHRAKRTNDA